MNLSKQKGDAKNRILRSLIPIFAVTSIAAVLAFLIGNSNFELSLKIFSLAVILLINLAICAFLANKFSSILPLDLDESEKKEEKILKDEISEQLNSLHEAKILTGGTLGVRDSLRFIFKRIENVFNYTNIVIALPESKDQLKIVQAEGLYAGQFLEMGKLSRRGIADLALTSNQPEIDRRMELEKTILDERNFENLKTAAAVPLHGQNGEVFGTLILYGDEVNGFDDSDFDALSQLSEIVSPIFENALNYERSLENALIDPLTKLPNERAFYLVLENQLAESQRSRETRPLTVLAADVNGGDELKDEFEENRSVSEEVFAAASKVLKEQLRDMDFVARAGVNEFAIILPTANAEIAEEIIRRIEQAAEKKDSESPNDEKFSFSFGAATFYQDGETGHELYQTALVKKDQSKKGKNSVAWFNKKQN